MAAKKSGTDRVTVGCKLPHGLQIHLPDSQERYKLNGANSALIIGGYGMTSLPADFANAWFAANASTPYVKNGSVFMASTEADAQDQAKEQSDVKTGTEPLNADTPVPGVKKDDGKDEA